MQGQGNETRKSPILPYSTDTTVAVQANGSQRRNKQNLDYVLRTGLAGGLAGCAVCLQPDKTQSLIQTIHML